MVDFSILERELDLYNCWTSTGFTSGADIRTVIIEYNGAPHICVVDVSGDYTPLEKGDNLAVIAAFPHLTPYYANVAKRLMYDLAHQMYLSMGGIDY